MKRDLIIVSLLAITAILVAWTRSPQPIDYAILAQAIAQVEGDRGRMGPAGEIGPLQITAICRRDLARIGFAITVDGCRSQAASQMALTAYCRHYRATSPRDAAALWNGGPGRHGSSDYADRVDAIYQRLQKQQKQKKAQKRKSVNTVSRVVSARIPVADYLQLEELAGIARENPSDLFRKIVSQYIKSYPDCLISLPMELAGQLAEHCPGKRMDEIAIRACTKELHRLQDEKHLAKLRAQREALNAFYGELKLSTANAKRQLKAMEESHA
jgi:hypothetical protein